ncbi:MAG: glycosyltransferase [Winogradskyella sp.]|nr:glycosyltransferase [Winogradskyella sp.]
MTFNILHLIDNVNKVNFGIWNAALMNSGELARKGVVSYAVFPDQGSFDYPDVIPLPFKKTSQIFTYLENFSLNPKNTLIISHGCWRWPTKIAHSLNKRGYKWMAVPHGMLEPWSMEQKKIKKKIYYNLIEKQLLKRADKIRAVSMPEYIRLSTVFGVNTIHIPNGITPIKDTRNKPTSGPIRFLFMARLHHKKGVVSLLEGWRLSSLVNNLDYELQIAGPDDGELIKIEPLISKCTNVTYLGAIYDKQKDSVLHQSHIYVLPSYSEGFPSSVLEAMDYGLLPLISEGCNFPEAFENNLVISLEPNAIQIADTLSKISELTIGSIIAKGQKQKEFVRSNYTNEIISNQLNNILSQLLKY